RPGRPTVVPFPRGRPGPPPPQPLGPPAGMDRDAGIDFDVVAAMREQVATYLSDHTDPAGSGRGSTQQTRQLGAAYIARLVADMLGAQARAGGPPVSAAAEAAWCKAVADACFGLGRLQPYVDDVVNVANIDVYGCDDVVVEYRGGRLVRVPPVFRSDTELVEMIARAARYAPLAREFSDRTPLLTTRLAGGSRLTAQTRVSPRPGLTVRNHQFVEGITLDTLLHLGTIDRLLCLVLRAAVRAGWNIIISGEQSAGKTTMLRALCAETPPWQKLVVIEREAELFLERLARPGQVVPLEAQDANAEGAGAIDMTALVVHALRMNAGRLILGEARSDEIVALLTAMSAGSRGAMATIHANRAQDVFAVRIPSLAMMANPPLPVAFSHLHAAAGLHLVVHLEMATDLAPDGTPLRRRRYVSAVAEVTGLEDGHVTSNAIFAPGPDGRAIPGSAIHRLDELVTAGLDPRHLQSHPHGLWQETP
ncbi:MAG: CpaF family protein, partial [Frankia sp.]